MPRTAKHTARPTGPIRRGPPAINNQQITAITTRLLGLSEDEMVALGESLRRRSVSSAEMARKRQRLLDHLNLRTL